VVEDVLYPQLYKMEQAAPPLLKEYDFTVIKTGVWSGKPETAVLLELYLRHPSQREKTHRPPPVWVKVHAEKFKEKYQGADGVFGGYNRKRKIRL